MRAIRFLITLGAFLVLCEYVQAAVDEPPMPSPQVLTNAAQIRHLTANEAANRLSVSLFGVLIDTGIAGPDRYSIILADQTGAIYAQVITNAPNFLITHSRGDLLKVTGVTGSGQFAPIVIANTVEKRGTSSVPLAKPVTYQQLITGALDAQWIEINGVVRQAISPATNSDIQRIAISADGGIVQARFSVLSNQLVQVDSEVRVQAICLHQFNQKRQVLTPVLQVPRGVPVVVTKPPPPDPYATPLRAANSLLTFSPENLQAYAHRVHVKGVVTASQAGSSVWIRDGNSGLRIQTGQRALLSPGDEIEVLGFPTFGFNTPELEDAMFRKIGNDVPPKPIYLTNFNNAFDHEDDLVATEGMLNEIQPILNGVAFTLDNNGQLFKGILRTALRQESQSDWRTGARVRITGICSLIHDDTRPFAGIWQPRSFEIFLRSPADFKVLVAPPWWNIQHIATVLAIVTGFLVMIVGAVVWISRHRLKEQESRRETAEIEFAAVLTERNRVAREIHDTLAQGLAATSVQLRLARKRLNGNTDTEATAHHLGSAQSLVSECLQEARNSIWNMRSHVLETNDLPGALKGILKHMAEDTDVTATAEISGTPRRFSPVMENDILRIGQEAIVNAVKHAKAKRIDVRLEFGEKQFRLQVKDDGCGFDPEKPPTSDGGFGLLGMRERATEINGNLTIRSEPQAGTEVNLTVPISGE